MIHFTHVTKSYEANWKALNNVTFRINKGEFVFLTGHSGAGKSTVLKLIYMDERPDEQRGGQVMVKFSDNVLYDSKNTPDDRIQALRRKMGIIFQDFKLLPDRNVFENVALALRIVGTPSNKINAAVFDALALVGISQKRFAMPYTLSGGEQQRVAIARAMVHNPYLLLADEPTGNLDPVNSNVWRLPARWCITRICFWLTNRPVTWTRKTLKKSSASSRKSMPAAPRF